MKSGIRRKVIIGILAFAVPLYLALAGAFLREIDERKNLILEGRLHTAQVLAVATDAYLLNMAVILGSEADDIAAGRAESGAAAEKLLRVQPNIYAAGVLDATGRLEASVPASVSPQLAAAPRSVIRKLDRDDRFAVSDLRIVNGIAGFNIVVPIKRAGRTIGYISAFSRASNLARRMATAVGSSGSIGVIGSDGRAIFLSFVDDLKPEQRDRSMIASVRSALRGKAATTVGFIDPIDGVKRLGASAPIPEAAWAANVFVPEDTALASQRSTAVIDLILLLILAGVGIVLVSLATSRLVKPLEEFGRASKEITSGNFDVRVNADGGYELEALSKAFNQMTETVENNLLSERKVADLIRQALIPSTVDTIPGIEVGIARAFASLQYRIGGDFYALFKISQTKVGVIVGDVTGKGLDAAAVAIRARYMLITLLSQKLSPGQALERLNADFTKNPGSEDPAEIKCITCVVAVIDQKARTMTMANAGHPWPLCCTGEECHQVPEHGMLIGVMPGAGYKDEVVHFDTGTRTIFVTDGVTEARKAHEDIERPEESADLYGELRLCKTVTRHKDRTSQEIADELYASIMRHTGGSLSDDTVILVLHSV